MSIGTAVQSNLFRATDLPLAGGEIDATVEQSIRQRRKRERPVAYPELQPYLLMNDEYVARRRAVSAENAQRKAQGLPKKQKSEAEKLADRAYHDRWIDACRALVMRGEEAMPLAWLLEEIKRRLAEDPAKYGLEKDPSKLRRDGILRLNCGVGQDSVTLCVLLALRLLPSWIYSYPVRVVFCDTMAERPDTYAYALNILIPFLERYSIEFCWLRPDVSHYYGLKEATGELAWLDEGVARTGTISQFHVTKNRVLGGLMETYMADDNPSYPMYSSRARCTENHKHYVMAREREFARKEWNGRTANAQSAQGGKDWVLVGIANDERGRAEPTGEQNYMCVYPLIGMNLGRAECVKVIEASLGRVPSKSGCVVCYSAPLWEKWYISQVHPVVFRQMELMEGLSIDNRLGRKLAPNYMVLEKPYNLPLREAVQRWHEDNPHVTVEMAAEWLITRTYNRDQKPDRCSAINKDQLTFDDLDDPEVDDHLSVLQRVGKGEFDLERAGD